MNKASFIEVATDLEDAGLVWRPEIGDEIWSRTDAGTVSILIDPQGMNPEQLRQVFLWLPSFEQMVFQLEARQAMLFHAGLEMSETALCYKTVIRARHGAIETQADSLRTALGLGLRDLLVSSLSRGRLH